MNKERYQEMLAGDSNGTGNGNMKMEHFCHKWKRAIAIGLGVLVFLMITIHVMLILYKVFNAEFCKDSRKIYNTTTINSRNIKASQYCVISDCVITCDQLPASNTVENELRTILVESSCDSIRKLSIIESKFPDDKIETNWLSSLEVEINHLEIKRTSITQIEDNAFNSSIFERLTYLTFEGTLIKYLQKNALRNLNLDTFEFRFNSLTTVYFESGLLEHVSTTLRTLQFNYCKMNSISLFNITGTTEVSLNRLLTLDLRFNGLQSIEKDLFVNARSLQQIYLAENSLSNVDVNAFSKLPQLRRLTLNDNALKSLPEGVFNNMPKNKEMVIHLKNNLWDCNCQLKWLKDFYLEYKYNDRCEPSCPIENVELENNDSFDSPTCSDPNNEHFECVDFCPTTGHNGTTTRTTTVDSETTTTTTVDSDTTTDMSTTESSKYTKILCRDFSRSPIVDKHDERHHVYKKVLNINNKNLTFDLFEVEQPFMVEVDIKGDIADFHILWFNNNNISDYGCATNLEPTIVFDCMERNQTYTICLLCQTDPSVSPHDCFEYSIQVENPERTWIQNRSNILSVAIAVLCTTAILGAGIMFSCVWICPTMLKHNKRVIVVGKKPKSVAPKEYEQWNYAEPSISTYSKGSYLTANGYARVKYRNYRPPILNTVSEKCEMEGNEYYFNPQQSIENQEEVHPQQIFQKNTRKTNYDYETPPPLPPLNNTSELRNMQDESLYMVV